MSVFAIMSLIYCSISVLLFLMLIVQTRLQRKLFISLFGSETYQMSEEEKDAWEKVHELRFQTGFWRSILSGYMLYHFPGFIVSVLLGRNGAISPLIIIIASQVIVVSLFYFFLG